MEKEQPVKTEVYRPVVKLIIALVIVVIIRGIITSLPMLWQLRIPGMPISIESIISAVFGIIAIMIFRNFNFEFVPKVQERWQKIPELGTIVKMSVILIMIVIAYDSFDGIIYPFIGGFSWIYPLAFLVLAIMPIYTLFMTLYRNVDKITDLATERIAKLPEKQKQEAKERPEVLSTVTYQERSGLNMQKEEAWSKERINAELQDLTWAKNIRLGIAIPFLLGGIFGGIGFLLVIGTWLEYARYGYGGDVMGEIIFLLIAIIVSLIIGVFSLKSWREKSRRYDELKAKL